MEPNEKGEKKYNSVRKAIKEIKNLEDERKKTGLLNQIPDNPASAPVQKTPIDDESLYESTDSTYDSLFLTKSVVRRAEDLGRSEVTKTASLDDDKSSITAQKLKDILSKEEAALQEKSDSFSRKVEEIKQINDALIEIEKAKSEAPARSKATSPVFEGEVKHDKSVAMTEGETVEESSSPETTPKTSGPKKVSLQYAGLFAVVFLLITTIFLLARTFSSSEISVKAERAKVGEFNPYLVAEGKVVYENRFPIYAEGEGKVVRVFCKTGDVLKKGDQILQVEMPQLKRDKENARFLLSAHLGKWKESALSLYYEMKRHGEKARSADELKTGLSKIAEHLAFQLEALSSQSSVVPQEGAMEKLLQEGRHEIEEILKKASIADSRLQMAELNYKLSCHDVQTSVRSLVECQKTEEDSIVKAAWHGRLASLEATTGDYVRPGSRIGTIEDTSRKIVEAEADDVYFPYLQKHFDPSLEATIRVPAIGNRHFLGKLRHLELDERSKKPSCRLRIEFSGEDVLVGLRAIVEIPLPPKPGSIQVRKSGVLFRQEYERMVPVIFILSKEKKERFAVQIVPVVLGMSNRLSFEVVHGLEGDELMVIGCSSGITGLCENMKVTLDDR